MKKLNITDNETERLATGIAHLGLEIGRVVLFKHALTRFTNRQWTYYEVLMFSAMVSAVGAWLNVGRRNEQEVHEVLAGV